MKTPRTLIVTLIAALMASANLAVGAVVLSHWDDPAVGGPNDPVTGAPAPCDAKSRVVYRNITALPVPIIYNNWGDLDPHGRVFIHTDEVDELLNEAITRLSEAQVDVPGVPSLFPQTIAELTAARDALPAPPALPASPDVVGALARLERAFFQDQDNLNKTLQQVGATAVHNLLPISRIQPLIMRVNVGDCVRVNLTNLLPEPVSFHVHDVVARPGQGMSLGDNDIDLTLPGLTREYVVYVPKADNMEGAHLFHSHADSRFQTRHGLFGALVAEPAGATYLAQDGVNAGTSGQQAIINMPTGRRDFREHVLIYHDEVELYGWVHIGAPGSLALAAKPVISPYGEYGPGSKAINLRAEPFMNRLAHHDKLQTAGILQTPHDKSQAYGSYTYGDPGVFIPMSYLGDPTKFRLVNAGPGQHHVHHLHGGGIRWRMSPVADDPQFSWGLTKEGNIEKSPSDRLDVQNIGVGESYNAVPEGGAGGVQQAVGDFLYHCHIVEHYVAGMWSFWRTFNTLQPGIGQLPDRVAAGDVIPEAVNSTALLNENYNGTVLDSPEKIVEWIKPQLPTQGVPEGYDASVWDYQIVDKPWGPLFLGEPESTIAFANYAPTTGRPEIKFNPNNGRLAYPLFTPHFGERPPFAPNHGPAPYLGTDVVPLYREDGLCPEDAPRRKYNIVATGASVQFTNNALDTDPNALVFVHAEDWQAVKSGAKNPKSMVLRANAGDCVDVLFRSDRPDEDSKTNMHIHLVQFDVQASDGVIAGFNYEQSVRPLLSAGTTLFADTDGTNQIEVVDATGLHVGAEVAVGLNLVDPIFRTVTAKSGNTLTLNESVLAGAVKAGDRVGYEYVRYRWYADVELGMVYWHDHVDGIKTWVHGLFGGLVVEPRGSVWCTPTRADAQLTDCPSDVSGHVVDVVHPTDGSKSFREIVLQVQDRACASEDPLSDCTAGSQVPKMPDPEQEPATINMRSAPFVRRNAEYPLASWADVNGVDQGDPSTEVPKLYPGDPVVIRLLYAGQSMTSGVGTFGVTGHRFQAEHNLPKSRLVDTLSFGISSQHNVRLECGAGGCHKLPGDYLYGMTNQDLMHRGAWGILRVLEQEETGSPRLQRLPGDTDIAPGTLPTGSGTEQITVYAKNGMVRYNLDPFEMNAGPPPALPAYPLDRETRWFALTDADTNRPEPFVYRVHAGKRVEVTVVNDMESSIPFENTRVTFHPSLLSADPRLPGGIGIPVGYNDVGDTSTTVLPGQSRTYTFYADAYDDRDLGAAHVSSWGSILVDSHHGDQGLYGALVVEPATSTFNPVSGPVSDIEYLDRTWREQVLLYRTQDEQFETSTMEYAIDPRQLTEVNYRIDPLHERVGGLYIEPREDRWVAGMGIHSCRLERENCAEQVGFRIDIRNPLNPLAFGLEAPETPVISARHLQGLVVRAIGASGDQLLTHHVQGHRWALDPDMNSCRVDLTTCRSNVISTVTLGPREVSNAWIPEAGPAGTGDYLYGIHRDPHTESGMWGILRVCPTLLPSGLCDLDDLTAVAPIDAAAVSVPFKAAEEEAAANLVAFHQRWYLDASLPSVSTDCTTLTGDQKVEIPPFAFFAFSTSTAFFPGFIPQCVAIASGGNVTWRNADVFSDHDPATVKDFETQNDNAATRCFSSAYHRPGTMPFGSEFKIWFRYQADVISGQMKLEASQNQVTWRDCTQEMDFGQTTGDYAVLPYQCDIHPNMVGTIVVAKTGATPASSVTAPQPGEPTWVYQ